MFIAELELRKFLQKPRTQSEVDAKLAKLAERVDKNDIPGASARILRGYQMGEDIPDPAFFWREDIEQFAKDYHLTNDILVQRFIALARPMAEWEQSKLQPVC